MPLIIKDIDNNTQTVTFTNTVGTPAISCINGARGDLLAGTYDITISNVSGDTAVATISCPNAYNNPHDARAFTIIIDSETINEVACFDMVFHAGASNGDMVQIVVHEDLDLGLVLAGTGDGLRLKVFNDSSRTVIGAQLRVLPDAYYVNLTSGELVAGIIDPTDTILPGTYNITIDNYTPGSPATADIYSNGFLMQENAALDGTMYDNIVSGISVAFGSNVTDDDIAIITIADGYQYIQSALDSEGTPLAYSNTTKNITEVGQSTGVITSSGEVFFWIRTNISDSATVELNPRSFRIKCWGYEV